MSQRRPDDAPPSVSAAHLHNNNNTTAAAGPPTTNTNSTTTTTTSSSAITTSSSSANISIGPSSTTSSNRQRRETIRKEKILTRPTPSPSSSLATAAAAAAPSIKSSLHSRATSRSSNLIHNNPPPPPNHRDRGQPHSRTKSSSLSTPSSRSQQKQPVSTPVVVTQITTTPASSSARAHRRHTSIAPPSQDQKPLAASVILSQRPATSHSESQLPEKTRQPARFSSNGIATSSGPPPSLAYRRNIAMENRFSSPRTVFNGNTSANGDRSNASSSTISHFSRNDSRRGTRLEGDKERERGKEGSSLSRRSSRVESRTNGYEEEGYEDRTIRGLEDLQRGGVRLEDGILDGGELASEDVFLNLARSNSVSSYTDNAAYKAERRRQSRLAQLAQHRNSLPADTFSASPLRATQTHTPGNRTLTNSPAPTRDETWKANRVSTPPTYYRDRRMSNASMVDNGDEQQKSVTPRASFSRPLSMLRRERSPGASHSRSFSMAEPIARTRSGLANSVTPRATHSSPQDVSPRNVIDRPVMGTMIDFDNADPTTPTNPEPSASGGTSGPEDSSSVSTTAPSTVWDELDDLKSRIRRLELTGRIPASGVGSLSSSFNTTGNASSSSGERPRTATTTVTTISSSPRNNNNNSSAPGVSPVNSSFSTHPSSHAHPLLHAALAKSKPLIPPDVFKYLEAAANDAVSLASTVGSTGSPGAPTAGSVNSDRQIRRKADSVCRSLTELCIALSENRASIAAPNFALHLSQHYGGGARPVSRDMNGVNESIIGRDRSESVVGGRERILGRERGESILGRDRAESILGRESVLGRESMLGRESLLGRESVIGDRLANRLGSRFAERKGSITSISTTAGFLNSSSRQQLGEKVPSPTGPSHSGHTGHLRSRNSMLLKARHMFDDDEDPESFRSPSRAATEVISHRHQRETTYHMTPDRSNSGALPPRRQYVITSASTTNNGLPSPVLHQRRFFSGSNERSEIRDRTSGDERSAYDMQNPVNERLVAAATADSDYSAQRFRSGSLGRPVVGGRRVTRVLRESVDLDSNQQGGSLGRTPGSGERLLRR